MKFLHPDYSIEYDGEDDDKPFSAVELDFAERHRDEDLMRMYYADRDSYARIVKCYLRAAEEGNLNAGWCLGAAFNHRDPLCDFEVREDDYVYASYYYLIEACSKGLWASASSFYEILNSEFKTQEAFQLTYLAARQGELFSMWNLAMYYSHGIVVPKSFKKAMSLYERIVQLATSPTHLPFIEKNYGSLYNPDVQKLLSSVLHNLKTMAFNPRWKEYFDMEER